MNLIINILESVGYVYYISNYLFNDSKYKKKCSIFLFLISVFFLSVSEWLNEIDPISLFSINVITFICCYKLSKKSNIEILFAIFYIETLIIVSNILSLCFGTYIFNNSIEMIYSNGDRLGILSFFSKCILCIISFLSTKVIKKSSYGYSKSLSLLLTITAMIFFCLSSGFLELVENSYNINSTFKFLIILSFILILCYMMFNTLKKENYDTLLKSLEYSELSSMKFYIEATKSISDENIRLKHHIDNLMCILNRDQSANIDLNVLNDRTQFVKTKNEVINSIFNTIIIMYKQKNIQWMIAIETCFEKIDQVDIAIILGTLLKTAAENTNDQDSIIFKAKEMENLYLISLNCSYDGDQDKFEKLEIIYKIAKKYKGIINRNIENKYLSYDILLKK